MATVTIRRRNGRRAQATFVRHVRTLAQEGKANSDVELYRLADGTEIECISPTCDSRKDPVEVDPAAPNYPGYLPGV